MNRNKKIYAGIVTLAVVCGAILTATTVNTRREAQTFLSELQAIQIGSTTFVEVQEIATRFRGHITDGTKTCLPNECDLKVRFDNAWLRRLHLAMPTTFGAVLLVRNGRLYYINAAMALYSAAPTSGRGDDMSWSCPQSWPATAIPNTRTPCSGCRSRTPQSPS